MAYFAMQYQMLFHDTMAYGSQHHMVNLKLQNIARETLLFESGGEGEACWQDQLKDLLLLTREAYSFNIAPIELGEKVAILLTYEAPTRSTVRLCFRITDAAGRAVSYGYQTLVVLHKDTQRLVPAPRLLTRYLDPLQGYSLLEPLTDPSFADRLQAGSIALKDLFTDEVCAVGRYVASAPLYQAYPKIIDTAFAEHSF